jgi:hypothetical protein
MAWIGFGRTTPVCGKNNLRPVVTAIRSRMGDVARRGGEGRDRARAGVDSYRRIGGAEEERDHDDVMRATNSSAGGGSARVLLSSPRIPLPATPMPFHMERVTETHALSMFPIVGYNLLWLHGHHLSYRLTHVCTCARHVSICL